MGGEGGMAEEGKEGEKTTRETVGGLEKASSLNVSALN